MLTITVLESQNIVWPVYLRVVILEPLHTLHNWNIQFVDYVAVENKFQARKKGYKLLVPVWNSQPVASYTFNSLLSNIVHECGIADHAQSNVLYQSQLMKH